MKKIERDAHVERYYPSVVALAKEFKVLAEAENPEFKLLYDAFWKWFANTFIFSTDLEGVERWENMLSIVPEKDATLEERRSAIFFTVTGGTPYTERALKLFFDNTYGKDSVYPIVTPNEYELVLDVQKSVPSEKTVRIWRYSRITAPANLTVKAKYKMEPKDLIHVGFNRRFKKSATVYPSTADKMDNKSAVYIGMATETMEVLELKGEI